jgi:gliding motility-associated lipoprotein GldH
MPGGTNRLLLLVFLPLILFSSCNGDVVFSGSEEMEKNTWNLMNVLNFDVEAKDTATSNNVIFTIRTGSDYPFRNIYLFITTTSPEGKTIGDTLNFAIADERGNWLGKGVGDVRSLNLPYKSNVYFPVAGTYRFSVRHGMRTEDLRGVYDFGMRVEKVKQ